VPVLPELVHHRPVNAFVRVGIHAEASSNG
jgi:hypothetical protein